LKSYSCSTETAIRTSIITTFIIIVIIILTHYTMSFRD